MVIERATPRDAPAAARLAAGKRAEYERYSPVFWRVAADAVEKHEPFLRFCLGSDEFTAFAARSGGDLLGIAVAQHRVAPPPLTTDAAWLLDDFFVTGDWAAVGGPLLDAFGAQPLVVLCARRDEAKRAFLVGRTYRRAASWWVRPVGPGGSPTPQDGFEGVVGPAPPVYDPGGTTALARSIDAKHVDAFTRWAAAQGAVLAIVPARAEASRLEAALAAAGYEPASDWFSTGIGPVTNDAARWLP
jgi:hypothetical protein